MIRQAFIEEQRARLQAKITEAVALGRIEGGVQALREAADACDDMAVSSDLNGLPATWDTAATLLRSMAHEILRLYAEGSK